MMHDSLPNSPFFWDSVHTQNILKNTMFQKPALLLFSDNKVPNLLDPLDGPILSRWVFFKSFRQWTKSKKKKKRKLGQ